MKLAGSDFADQAARLDVATQVNRLVNEARSDLNLCQLCTWRTAAEPHTACALGVSLTDRATSVRALQILAGARSGETFAC
jgi:hypothetical protein